MLRALATFIFIATAAAAPAAPRADPAEKSADPVDKVFCKSFTETGSLVKRTRICKTKADWQRERDALRHLDVANSCATAGNGIGCK